MATEIVTDSSAKDEDDIEGEKKTDSGLDREEGDKTNEKANLYQRGPASKRYRAKAREAQLRERIEKLSKGDQLDATQKPKRPKWTRHEKWEMTKLGHEDEISKNKEGMDLTIKKSSIPLACS